MPSVRIGAFDSSTLDSDALDLAKDLDEWRRLSLSGPVGQPRRAKSGNKKSHFEAHILPFIRRHLLGRIVLHHWTPGPCVCIFYVQIFSRAG